MGGTFAYRLITVDISGVSIPGFKEETYVSWLMYRVTNDYCLRRCTPDPVNTRPEHHTQVHVTPGPRKPLQMELRRKEDRVAAPTLSLS